MADLPQLLERRLAQLPADAGWRADAAFMVKLRALAIASGGGGVLSYSWTQGVTVLGTTPVLSVPAGDGA